MLRLRGQLRTPLVSRTFAAEFASERGHVEAGADARLDGVREIGDEGSDERGQDREVVRRLQRGRQHAGVLHRQ